MWTLFLAMLAVAGWAVAVFTIVQLSLTRAENDGLKEDSKFWKEEAAGCQDRIVTLERLVDTEMSLHRSLKQSLRENELWSAGRIEELRQRNTAMRDAVHNAQLALENEANALSKVLSKPLEQEVFSDQEKPSINPSC
jgi:biopolymer transport protein ExbB/TolQ